TFLEDPTGWIGGRYGGGKFKMNLHHGLHFVNTRNFKPEGAPQWQDAPALDVDARAPASTRRAWRSSSRGRPGASSRSSPASLSCSARLGWPLRSSRSPPTAASHA